MSAGVSQISTWREQSTSSQTNTGKETTGNAGTDKPTAESGPGAIFLSYDLFLGLSIIAGFFALDHLYLRSPLTFLGKFLINILFFGAWWIYDASQAFFNKDVVKVFGLNIPSMGPSGIGAGVLASDIPDKKHLSFLIYSFALFFGGLFGLDSFIVGSKQIGIIRVMCLLSVILIPVAIAWWLFNLFTFFFKTQNVINSHWEYFGAPPPASPAEESFFMRLPVIGGLFKTLFGTAEKIVKESVGPFKNTIEAGINVAETGIETVQDGILLGKEALATGATLASKTLNVVGETADAASKALELAPAAAAMTTGFTPTAAQQALNTLNTIPQKGGAIATEPNLAGYMLVATIIGVTVSGIILTYRRSKQNGKQSRKDDPPPEPRVL